MNKLNINLENCYGIQSLECEFDFTPRGNRPLAKAYAIYAPNGLMKSSFAKTFDQLSNGLLPSEERYNRTPTHIVASDGAPIQKEVIYVLKSEIDISSDNASMTNILVNPESKARYDELLVDLDRLKNKLLGSLQKSSKNKKTKIEQMILDDWQEVDFPSCISKIKAMQVEVDLAPYEYATIFDTKTIEVLQSQEFISRASEFNDRYQELFSQVGTIYQKGVFNPAKADLSFSTLSKQGFFEGGHRVHLRGDESSIDKEELDQKIQEIHASIDTDEALKKLRTNLAKNAQTQALTDLIETLSSIQVEFLLDRLKPENQDEFRKDLWVYYIQNNADSDVYLESYSASKDELSAIESDAAQAAPRWEKAVELFNERFIDMPFSLSVSNQAQATLGKDMARLKFTFVNGSDTVEWSRSELKTLSQCEKRALYLLNFIFDVESRKLSNQETLFVIDDIADSFDYKNKHAIIQYLDDLTNTDYFHQIILTHNFDFFRAINNNFVPYNRCLMANKGDGYISIEKADGIKNYFIGKLKDNVTTDDCILCATIPFTRNLLEYTKGEADADYLKLTSLLHWKIDTEQITIGDYLGIYNRLFNTDYDISNTKPVVEVIFEKSNEICISPRQNGLNLEDKVLLSIAIRLQAELFLTNELRRLKNNENFWCEDTSQFSSLIKEYIKLEDPESIVKTVEEVSITVSSNIHLNSFMYEPILDLTIGHLIRLYNEVCALNTPPQI